MVQALISEISGIIGAGLLQAEFLSDTKALNVEPSYV